MTTVVNSAKYFTDPILTSTVNDPTLLTGCDGAIRRGNLQYCCCPDNNSLIIIDIRVPNQQVIKSITVDNTNLKGAMWISLSTDGTIAYIVSQTDNMLYSWDVTNPELITFLDSISIPSSPRAIATMQLEGKDYLGIVANFGGGVLSLISAVDPSNLVDAQTLQIGAAPRGVKAKGDKFLCTTTTGSNALVLVTASLNPATLILEQSFTNPLVLAAKEVHFIDYTDGLQYCVWVGRGINTNQSYGIQFFRIDNGVTLTPISYIEDVRWSNTFTTDLLAGTVLLGASRNTNYIFMLDFTEITLPVRRGFFQLNTTGKIGQVANAFTTSVYGSRVLYSVNTEDYLWEVSLANFNAPTARVTNLEVNALSIDSYVLLQAQQNSLTHTLYLDPVTKSVAFNDENGNTKYITSGQYLLEVRTIADLEKYRIGNEVMLPQCTQIQGSIDIGDLNLNIPSLATLLGIDRNCSIIFSTGSGKINVVAPGLATFREVGLLAPVYVNGSSTAIRVKNCLLVSAMDVDDFLGVSIDDGTDITTSGSVTLTTTPTNSSAVLNIDTVVTQDSPAATSSSITVNDGVTIPVGSFNKMFGNTLSNTFGAIQLLGTGKITNARLFNSTFNSPNPPTTNPLLGFSKNSNEWTFTGVNVDGVSQTTSVVFTSLINADPADPDAYVNIATAGVGIWTEFTMSGVQWQTLGESHYSLVDLTHGETIYEGSAVQDRLVNYTVDFERDGSPDKRYSFGVTRNGVIEPKSIRSTYADTNFPESGDSPTFVIEDLKPTDQLRLVWRNDTNGDDIKVHEARFDGVA